MPAETTELRSAAFRKQREATWRRLELLVLRVERGHLGQLGAAELSRLPRLYRATLSALSVARAISLDRNLVQYLESLSSRAYFCVHGPKRPLPRVLGDFTVRTFPATLRRHRWKLALAALFLAIGTLAGFLVTRADPDRFYAIVPESLAQGRGPSSTTAELREVLYSGGEATDQLAVFATFLFTHNARIGILAFALGGLAGLPVLLLLLTNGLMLGAFAALYHGRGLGVEFWAWLLPHGVPEFLAVAVCGAAGLMLAQALLFPGRHTRRQNLALQGRTAGQLVLGAVGLFLLAGLTEGIFRQTVHDVTVRYAAVAAWTLALLAYFTLLGRGRAAA